MAKVTKRDCEGCRDDFYNGHNDLGVSECWMFKSATMESKLDVPVDLHPPYKMRPTSRPNCYKKTRYVRITKDSLTKDGFWR